MSKLLSSRIADSKFGYIPRRTGKSSLHSPSRIRQEQILLPTHQFYVSIAALIFIEIDLPDDRIAVFYIVVRDMVWRNSCLKCRFHFFDGLFSIGKNGRPLPVFHFLEAHLHRNGYVFFRRKNFKGV